MFIRNLITVVLMTISIGVLAVENQINSQVSEGEKILADIDNEKNVAQMVQEDDVGITKADYRIMQETHRFYLIAGMIAVTPIFLMILLSFIRKSTDFNEQAIIHSSGLVLVVQATVIVVIASPTTEQLTAAIGVLAAIAGYLFGSAKRSKTGS